MRYQLRHAAGMYWLLDTRQEGMPYKKPLSMNEIGADIWKMMVKGLNKEQIVKTLCREYQVAQETVLQDVEQFQAQLLKYGIDMSDIALDGSRKE